MDLIKTFCAILPAPPSLLPTPNPRREIPIPIPTLPPQNGKQAKPSPSLAQCMMYIHKIGKYPVKVEHCTPSVFFPSCNDDHGPLGSRYIIAHLSLAASDVRSHFGAETALLCRQIIGICKNR